MRVLAFDVATAFGWAVGGPHPEPVRFGCDRLPGDVGDGRLMALWADRIADLVTEHEPTQLAVEKPFIHAKFQPMQVRRWYGMLAIVQLVAWRRDLPAPIEVPSSSAKLFFTGSGKASKADVVAECRARGWAVESEDTADALAVMATALKRYIDARAAA